jgi:predicted acylesterase/phospholipase RssA
MLTHLVFSGSNIWGITYIGVLRYLYINKLHLDIKDVAGTSFGSIIALFFALKVDIEIIEKGFYDYANDDELITISKSLFSNIFDKLGFDNVFKYLKYFKEYIKDKYKKDDFTFLEVSKIFGINLHINTLCVNDGKNVIFNIENTPNISVFSACAASMALPIIYQPINIEDKLYIDAGLITNVLYDQFKHVPKESILLVIKNLNNKSILETDKCTLVPYIIQIVSIHLENFNHYATGQYIDDKKALCITIEDISLDMTTDITNDGITQKITKEKIDKCILYGYRRAYELFEKGAKELSN